MTAWFIRGHLFLARHRGVVTLVLGLLALGAVLLIGQLKLNENIADMLPLSRPEIAEQFEALQRIRQTDRMFINVGTTTPDPDRLAQAADRMYEALRQIPALKDIRYTYDASELREVYQQLLAQVSGLASSNDLRTLESRLQPAAIEKRLAWLKKAMTQPQGLALKEVAQSDPLGLGDLLGNRLRALQAGLGAAQVNAGRLTSTDGCHVLITAAPEFPSTDVQKSAFLVASVLAEARHVEEQLPPGAVHIAVTGAHRAALDNSTLIKQDTTRTSVLAVVGVVLLLLAACGRWWFALMSMLPILFGALGAVAAFYFTSETVSAIALGCGSILIGVTVDYGIYILYHLEEAQPAHRERLAQLVAQLAPPLTFCALTSMAAFLVMLFSPVAGHRQLGLFASLGIALAALFALVFLPLWVPVGQVSRARLLPLTRMMQRLFAWKTRQTRLVFPLLLVFSLLCLGGLLRLRFEGDLARLNGVTPPMQRDEELFKQTWAKTLGQVTTIVVSGTTLDEALARNEIVYCALEALQQSNVIESFSSVAPLLPSLRTRQENQQHWRNFWTPQRLQEVTQALSTAASVQGFRDDVFAPRLKTLSEPPAPVELTSVAESPLLHLLGDYLSETEKGFSLCTLVRCPDPRNYARLRSDIHQATSGARLLNLTVLMQEIMEIAKRALPLFAFWVTVLNAALLFLLLGRLELVGLALLPIFVGVFWTLGILGWLGIPINMANFIFVIFVVGVGGDYSLFLVNAQLEPVRGLPERTASTGASVAHCAMTTLLGMGVLVLARHPALFSIGVTALLGISFSLVATLFLVPPLAGWLLRPAPVKPIVDLANLAERRRQITRAFRYQGPYAQHYVYWKLKTDPLFNFLDAVTPPKGLILDLGCGYGLEAFWLRQSSPQRIIQGWDHDTRKIRVAQAVNHQPAQVSFVHQDVLTGAYPRYDVVLLIDVLHYFPRGQKAALLKKAREALSPGGRLIVRDALSNKTRSHRTVALSERWAVWMGHNQTASGLHFESESDYLDLLREAGFEEIQVEPQAGLGSNAVITAQKPA